MTKWTHCEAAGCGELRECDVVEIEPPGLYSAGEAIYMCRPCQGEEHDDWFPEPYEPGDSEDDKRFQLFEDRRYDR